ncbi:hypothetical protein D3C72_1199750 [compost metagenome]
MDHLRQRHLPPLGQRMRRRHDRAHGRGVPDLDVQAMLRAQAHRHAEVDQAFAHAARHLALHAHVEREADAGTARLERSHQGRQELVGEAFGRGHAHLALAQAAQREDVVGHALDVEPGPARVRRQQLAG